ncbi:MAG: hypothetical protein AAFY08_00815 [Planctomycetota bacterium]
MRSTPRVLAVAFTTLVAVAAGVACGQSLSAEAERRTQARLNRPISVDFRGVPLEQAIAYVRALTGVNVDVRWNRLEEAGVPRDASVELVLNDVPAGIVLRRALQQVSTEFDPIDYAIEGGIVTTSTRRQLDQRMVTRIYDVRGDLMPIRDFNNAPELDLNQVLNGVSDGGAGDLFQDNDDDEPVQTRAERVQELIDLIRLMITDRDA